MSGKTIKCPECGRKVPLTPKCIGAEIARHWAVTATSYREIRSSVAKERIEFMLNALAEVGGA